MTQTINPTAAGQIIPFKDAERPEQSKASKERAAADVGASIVKSEAVSTITSSEVTGDPLERAAQIIEEVLPDQGLPNTRLVINKDDSTGDFVYQTLDNDTGEVIKQFPPETIMEMLTKIREVEGVVIDKLA